jgi:hypothetical protein
MNDLLAMQDLLMSSLTQNFRLALATTVAWLTPAQICHLTYENLDEEEPDDIQYALDVCRAYFPSVYATASSLIWQGSSGEHVAQHICDGLNQFLVAGFLNEIEEVRYGIPMDMVGIYLSADLFDLRHFHGPPNYLPILEDFGITEDTASDPEIDEARNIALMLNRSLQEQQGTIYECIVALINWLFSHSGNTMIDTTDEDFYESGWTLMDWTAENIEFMAEIATEAYAMLDQAELALKILATDTELRAAFRRNIRILSKPSRSTKTTRKETNRDHLTRQLQWPSRS